MTEPIEILIIGAGHMGGAIAAGLKRASLDTSITIIDPNPARREEMKKMGIRSSDTLPKKTESEAIILAIPPQSFELLSKHSPQLNPYKGLIVSVMAGIPTSVVSTRLNSQQICRAIPNIACAIGESVTILTHTPELTLKNRTLAEHLFTKLGKIITTEESLIDAATALVGGGPAYISYFTAALIEYGISSGFDKAQASMMAIQTLRGATALIESSLEPPMTICEKVMTPNGTTVRAINFFNDMQLRTIITEGLKHASARSSELGEGV